MPLYALYTLVVRKRSKALDVRALETSSYTVAIEQGGTICKQFPDATHFEIWRDIKKIYSSEPARGLQDSSMRRVG